MLFLTATISFFASLVSSVPIAQTSDQVANHEVAQDETSSEGSGKQMFGGMGMMGMMNPYMYGMGMMSPYMMGGW